MVERAREVAGADVTMADAIAHALRKEKGVSAYSFRRKRVRRRAGARPRDLFWEPKTRVNRVEPVSSTLRKYLDAWIVPYTKCGWYFPSSQGARWDVDNFSRDLARENRKAKLKWACLDYRHTFWSQLAMNGESLYKISNLMGNSPEICRRHYAALVPEEMAEAAEF